MRPLGNQFRFPTYEDVPELCPVLIVFVDQKRYAWHSPDVSQTRQSFWFNTLRFAVYSCVDKLAVVSKTDRYDVWSILVIQRRKPRNSGLLQDFLNCTRNL